MKRLSSLLSSLYGIISPGSQIVLAKGLYTLPFMVKVSGKGTYKTEFTTKQPNMEGHVNTTFSFNGDLKNLMTGFASAFRNIHFTLVIFTKSQWEPFRKKNCFIAYYGVNPFPQFKFTQR